MQLPLEILFEPPRVELRTGAKIVGGVATVAMIVGIVGAVAIVKLGFTARPQDTGLGTLQVVSVPSGAVIEEDGRDLGRTPALLSLPAGEHRIAVRADGYSAATYQVDLVAGETTALNADLWLQSAAGQQFRSPLPGATIANAAFLSNGDVALLLTLPSSTERQLWVIARNGQPERVGPARADRPLAISSDGTRVAYLAPGQGSRSIGGRLEEVWISGRSGAQAKREWVLPASRKDEALVDVAWAPDGQHLLLISRQQSSVGGTRSHLLWLAIGQAEPTEILTLPGDVLPGSYEWGPAGEHVAFLVRTQQATSLCVLRTADGDFRYLGDVRRNDSAALPFSPVGWAPDGGRLVYATLTATRTSNNWWLFGDGTRTALSVADLASPQPQPLGKADGQSPAWRNDGGVVALAQPKDNGPLVVRLVDAQGGTSLLSSLPFTPGTAYAARWDLAHAQALIATRSSTTSSGPRTDFWLVRFRQELEP